MPWPPIGRVESQGYNQHQPLRAKALPVPFSWPLRIANLKRCLLVERVPIEGSDKTLVLVNLHMEHSSDGGRKAPQMGVLGKLLEAERSQGGYVIAGGDFNRRFPVRYGKYPLPAESLLGAWSDDGRRAADGFAYACDLI